MLLRSHPATLPLFLALLALVNVTEVHAFVPPPSSSASFRSSSPVIVKSWVDTRVEIDVPASPHACYELYSQLEEHPRWSPWLRSVQFLDKVERTSEWTLESRGFTISWKAVNTIEEPARRISWESTTGLPNKGLVTFEEKAPGMTCMALTISYSVPKPIAKLGDVKLVKKYIESTLYSDLTRYKTVLLKDIRENRIKMSAEEGQA